MQSISKRAKNLPAELEELIYSKFQSINHFAVSECNLQYDQVYATLLRSDQKQLQTLKAMADPLGVDRHQLAQILLIKNLAKRDAALRVLLKGRSVRQWAAETVLPNGKQMEASTIHYAIKNLEQTRLRTKMQVVSKLNLDLERFAALYGV